MRVDCTSRIHLQDNAVPHSIHLPTFKAWKLTGLLFSSAVMCNVLSLNQRRVNGTPEGYFNILLFQREYTDLGLSFRVSQLNSNALPDKSKTEGQE